MAVRAGYRSPFQRCPALRPTLDFPSSRRRWGFLVFPQAHCCHFPFRTHGVSLLGCYRNQRGFPFLYPASPAVRMHRATRDQLPGKYQHRPRNHAEGHWRRRKRKSGLHLPILDQFPLQRPPVVAARSPTSQATNTPPCQVPSILRLMLTRPWLVFLTSLSPAFVLEACTLCLFSDHSHS